jgi:type IV secretory pathway VirB4 component
MINKLFKKEKNNLITKKIPPKKDILENGGLKINDIIAPDSITNHKLFYALGSRLTRTIIVTNYPRTVHIGWLDELFSYDANIDISIHITPWPTTKVIKTLNKKIGEYMSTMNIDSKDGRMTDIEVTSALDDAEELRDKLHAGSSKFFYQSIYISVSARFIEELDQLTEDIESLCGGLNMTTRIAAYRQDQAFLSVIPIGNDRIRKTRNFDTEALSTSFPLVSAELTDMRGNPILYGINQINNSLVMFDRFKLSNFNSVTLATTGAGKSYTVKLEAIRYFLMGTKIIIIDPQKEYLKLTEELGGQYINLNSSSKDRINPLDVYEKTELEEDQKDFLTSKIIDVYSMIQVMLGNQRKITSSEMKILLQALQEMYSKYGITRQGFENIEEEFIDDEFISVGNSRQLMPTLTDLDTALKETSSVEGLKLAQELEPYTLGIMSMFNGETNVDLDNDFIVFGIKDLEDGMKDIAMFIALEYIWNKVTSADKQRRLIIVDEAWMMMKNESSAKFLEKVAKTARKFGTGLSVVSQNVKDFMENGGENIILNTSMQILLRQNPKELDYLVDSLGISESEKVILRTLDTGEALIYAGQNKTLVKIVSNDFEHFLCETTS